MGTIIATVQGSVMHRTAVEMYLWHTESRDGTCIRCGYRMPCQVRIGTLLVMAAAGDHPRNYDPPQGRSGVLGLSMSGRAPSVDASGLQYQRDFQ